jgi:hypothetical protein
MTQIQKRTLLTCLLLFFLAGAVSFSGCSTITNPIQPVAGNGTIRLFNAEEGLYGIFSTDGAKYIPLTLPPEFQVEGMNVSYTVVVNTSVTATPGVGTPVDVIELVQLSPPGDLVYALGTVQYVNLEGGFYGIVVDKGSYGTVDFFPLNLDEQYQVNNTMIRFTGIPQKDLVTTVQWGIPIRITSVQRV